MNQTHYATPADYDEAAVVTFEWYDIRLTTKIVSNKVNALLGTRTIDHIPYEDQIHPYPLAFDPPLIEHAVGEKNGFAHRWEKLNYAFALPNPADFPILTALTDEDKELLRRFVSVCRQLAGYSAINGEAGLHYSHKEGGEPEITLTFPTPEAFAGTSVAFRQLHNDGEDASFSRVQGRLMKAVQALPVAERAEPKGILARWTKARGKLMNKQLEYIVSTKIGTVEGNPAPPDFPFSYCNINPEKLIKTFNYGDTIHFSGEQQILSELLESEQNAAYYKHAVLLAITSLSHLYFGFALLAEAAMGQAPPS